MSNVLTAVERLRLHIECDLAEPDSADLHEEVEALSARAEAAEAERDRLERLGMVMAEVIKASGSGAPLPAQEAAAEFFRQIDNMRRARDRAALRDGEGK